MAYLWREALTGFHNVGMHVGIDSPPIFETIT